jgi:hypothetical protein
MLRYEAHFIHLALKDTGGKVTPAAHLLGLPGHQALQFILNHRHKNLLAIFCGAIRNYPSLFRSHYTRCSRIILSCRETENFWTGDTVSKWLDSDISNDFVFSFWRFVLRLRAPGGAANPSALSHRNPDYDHFSTGKTLCPHYVDAL